MVISKNSFPIILDEDKKNNTTTPASNNISVSTSNNNNISYCFPDENDEVMLWDNLTINEKEVDYQQQQRRQDPMTNINLSVLGDRPINEEMDYSTTYKFQLPELVEEDNYGNLDELYLDGEPWNVFN
ncbi:hypothetical protein V6N13_140546 [Hibiscus sabdariffa]